MFDGALVVEDGDALADALSELPYLDVKRKDWKKAGTHQWKVFVKRDMGRWLNRVKRYLGWAGIATINTDGENDWVYFGDGWSPLYCMNMLPSFDAIKGFVGVLEKHVDLDFDYKAERERRWEEIGIVIVSVLAFAPFLYHMVSFLPLGLPVSWMDVVATLPLYVGWGVLGIFVSLLLWHNLMVLAGLREGKWWIFTSHLKVKNKG